MTADATPVPGESPSGRHRAARLYPLGVEEWRTVPGFPSYEVSSFGRMLSRRLKTPRIMRGKVDVAGYPTVHLSRDDGRSRVVPVHRLVAAAFLGPRLDGQEVRHLDGDRLNNRADNLQYGTHAENVLDAVQHGTHPQASKTHCRWKHPYDAENTRLNSKGGRVCRTCARRNDQAFKARRSAEGAA